MRALSFCLAATDSWALNCKSPFPNDVAFECQRLEGGGGGVGAKHVFPNPAPLPQVSPYHLVAFSSNLQEIHSNT